MQPLAVVQPRDAQHARLFRRLAQRAVFVDVIKGRKQPVHLCRPALFVDFSHSTPSLQARRQPPQSPSAAASFNIPFIDSCGQKAAPKRSLPPISLSSYRNASVSRAHKRHCRSYNRQAIRLRRPTVHAPTKNATAPSRQRGQAQRKSPASVPRAHKRHCRNYNRQDTAPRRPTIHAPTKKRNRIAASA